MGKAGLFENPDMIVSNLNFFFNSLLAMLELYCSFLQYSTKMSVVFIETAILGSKQRN